MRTLLAFELKKLISRKVPWVALLLALVVFPLNPLSTNTRSGTHDEVQAMRDVYRQYEGQVVTDALQARMQQDYDGYIAAHPDSFRLEEMDGLDDGSGHPASMYWPSDVATQYDSGTWEAYTNLIGKMSLEDRQEFVRNAEERLAAGTDGAGKPLTPAQRRSLQETAQNGVVEPAVHYAKGWENFFRNEPLSGLLVLVIAFMALLGLFNGEASARLDSVVLCTKARRKAVWAKLLVGAAVCAGMVLLFFGLQLAQMALIWGLDGAMLPATALTIDSILTKDSILIDMPILADLALSALVLVLAAVACGAVVAWASAQFRHALLTMLSSGAILGGMIWLWQKGATLIGTETPLADAISRALHALPPNTLMNTYSMPQRVANAGTLALLVIVPVVLTALFLWLAHHAFLRRRKA